MHSDPTGLQAHHRLWSQRPKSAEWHKWGRMSDGNREVTEAFDWGPWVSCQPTLWELHALVSILSGVHSRCVCVVINRPLVTLVKLNSASWLSPSEFHFHVQQTPRPSDPHRRQGVLPSKGKRRASGRNKTHKTSQSCSYLAWPAWEEASTFASLKECSLYAQNRRRWSICGADVTGSRALFLSPTMRKWTASGAGGKVFPRMRKGL